MMGIPTTTDSRRSIEWIEAAWSLQFPLGSSLGRVWATDETIAEARNAICERALEVGAKYVFFLSDDVLPPGNAVLTMLDKIGLDMPVENGNVARCDMLTGVYWTKSDPPEPYLWQGLVQGSYKEWTAGEFFPVDLAGCDCLLISTDVLRGTPRPWFSTDWVWEAGQTPSAIATEDFYFFAKARKHGFRLFADTSIQCGHEDRTTGRIYGIMPEMRQAGGIPMFGQDVKVIADLGAGGDSPFFGENVQVVKFDARPDTRPDVRCDIRHIPDQWFGQFDVIHSRHVLEHFGREEGFHLLRHWVNLLKDGGEVIVRVPNIRWAFKTIADPDAAPSDRKYAMAQLWGGQQYPLDYHKNGFDARKLGGLLASTPGLTDITVVEEEDGLNLMGRAIYHPPKPEVLADIWNEFAEAEQAKPATETVTETEWLKPAEAPENAKGDPEPQAKEPDPFHPGDVWKALQQEPSAAT